MDFNLISRLESHGKDLYKLGQGKRSPSNSRLTAISEDDGILANAARSGDSGDSGSCGGGGAGVRSSPSGQSDVACLSPAASGDCGCFAFLARTSRTAAR